MPHKRDKNRTYSVGYGKPPEKNQFKPGISGNPNGRPKASLKIDTTLENELRMMVVVTENGKTKRITKAQAMVRQMIHRSLTGDNRATQTVLKLMKELDIAPADLPVIEITADIPALPASLRVEGEPVEMQQETSRYQISQEDFDKRFGKKK
ncbi:hypothetical protein BH10PSE11_BH10PSE11_17850 [soil metagenome]